MEMRTCEPLVPDSLDSYARCFRKGELIPATTVGVWSATSVQASEDMGAPVPQTRRRGEFLDIHGFCQIVKAPGLRHDSVQHRSRSEPSQGDLLSNRIPRAGVALSYYDGGPPQAAPPILEVLPAPPQLRSRVRETSATQQADSDFTWFEDQPVEYEMTTVHPRDSNLDAAPSMARVANPAEELDKSRCQLHLAYPAIPAASNTFIAPAGAQPPKRGTWAWVENSCNECGNQCRERHTTADWSAIRRHWGVPKICCSYKCLKTFVWHKAEFDLDAHPGNPRKGGFHTYNIRSVLEGPWPKPKREDYKAMFDSMD